jgi:hypothetical protein
MPLYSMSRTHASQEVEKAEERGERVVFVVPDGATLIVVTAAAPKAPNWGLETRA